LSQNLNKALSSVLVFFGKNAGLSMDKRLKKMEERLSGTEPTDEEKRKMRQAEKEVDAICDRIDPFVSH
jgi:hypothetical protein